MRFKNLRMACGLGVILLGVATMAEAEDRQNYALNVVTVLGSKEGEASLPGSGDSVSVSDIRKHSYDDVNRILRKIPGVYLREEDGHGLFPNISLRGVDVGRSQKVTLMEDGVTAAPAPYSAPSAYYSPTAGRMNKIEVLKGSSQVKYGPHTTGGVVNYLSTPIPKKQQFYLKGLYGDNEEGRVHAYVGDTMDTSFGRIGYLLEEYYRSNDGFKVIDTTADFTDGGDTGFTKSEPMLKLSWESSPETLRYQKVEGKFGYTDLDANETYLGLTESDFDDNPYRRYAATRFDNIQTRQSRSYLRYGTELNEHAMVTLTGYYNEFQRNWSKLQSVSGSSLSSVLASGGAALDVMRGTAAGTFDVRNNNREYAQWGLLNNVNFDLTTGDFTHDIEWGLGFHQDYVRRDQNTDTYTQDASGVITGISSSAPGTAGNRRQESISISSYLRDNIDWGAWTFTPGFRYEHVQYEFVDFSTGGVTPGVITAQDSSDITAFAGGAGLQYVFSDELSAFGGVHQGFSVPGPRDNAKSDLDEETSLTKELGLRWKKSDALSTELTYFHTNFDDLLVKDNIGGGGTGDSENIGKVVSQGLEFKAQYDFGIANEKAFKNPYYLALTYTNAELDGDSNSTDAESIFSGGKDGNKVPYVPEVQFSVGTGLEFEKWGVFVDGSYVPETFTTANNVDAQLQADGTTPDARFGKTDEFFVVDVSGHYNLTKNAKVLANLHNVGDLEYIVSRHPHGPRPGKPFTATFGMEVVF